MESLRERKKAITRRAIRDAAERLFAERGYDEVTVAEIADAANVSVKTLFVYFRSKEDLVFADTELLDRLIAALAARPADVSHAWVFVDVLAEAAGDGTGLVSYHRAYGESPALRSGLLRMWAEFEDRVVEQLAAESGGPATPAMRLHAIQLVGIVRTTTSPELRANPDGLADWLREAPSLVEG
ncbi:TetR/AcrR family transcriptional regulator [Kutzneria sp. CA-103260]|uniref:TetR/AcrR family transcriptional regulator n=1 Tax=Kutzneria sp. CA-103260 TaxID=2802641 RepID=UPI001BA82A8A|nr:TetR/AcrR family transcriptional regulator [Kutzneria sp. CA-103260]QUQ63479.1 HTH-type transcriptional regulator BetI [Kutzneria sp. CA-103260]